MSMSMSVGELFVVLMLIISSYVSALSNDYPIVLVHGFSGWGRDEMLGLKYWGGIQGDLQEQLKAQGYTVYTAAVGPFSSNWDRACELYAQIKGGTVDYGAKHSETHGHKRYGRTFKGLYPEWGNTNANGKTKKIHIIAHSMGGQTSRMLAQLLAKGSNGAPVQEDPSIYTSGSIFAGGKSDWIHSITTISTPNRGTLLADGFSEIGDLVKKVAIGALSVLGIGGDSTAAIYDAKLDQWGLDPKRSNENLVQYIERVFQSRMFQPGFQDICIWSLSTDGAKEENTWVETLGNIYYYSYSTLDTHASKNLQLKDIHKPNLLTMLLPLSPLGTFLGGRYGQDRKGFSKDWQANDGVVNTLSMASSHDNVAQDFSGVSYRGKWNRMKILNRLDHLAVIGITLHTQILSLYKSHASLLRNLPTSNTLSVQDVNEDDLHESTFTKAPMEEVSDHIESAIAALNEAAQSIETKHDLFALCSEWLTSGNEYAENYCINMLENAEELEKNEAENNATRRLLRTEA